MASICSGVGCWPGCGVNPCGFGGLWGCWGESAIMKGVFGGGEEWETEDGVLKNAEVLGRG
jgi:hypothetical protein